MEKAVKTSKLQRQGGSSILSEMIIGLFIGLLLIQLLKFGWIMALLVLGVGVAFLIGTNSYLAWTLLLIACAASRYRYITGEIDIRPEHVVLAFTLMGWFLALLSGKVRLHKVPMLLPLLAYFGVNVASSILYSQDMASSIRGLGLIFMNISIYIVTVNILSEHPEMLKKAMKLLLLVGVVQVVYALIALGVHYGGVDLDAVSTRQVEGAVSLRGFLEEPNFLAAFAASIGLIYLGLLTGRDAIERKWGYIAGLALIIAVLPLTYTRAAWLGFFVGFILLFFLQKPRQNIFNPKAGSAVIIILIVAVIAVPIIGSFNTALTEQGAVVAERSVKLVDFSQGSGKGRMMVQVLALERWRDAILMGGGTMSFPADEYSEIEYTSSGAWLYSSNIQALHDSGLVGLMFFLWAQVGIILTIIRGYNRATDPFYKAALAGLIAGSIALIIASQASSFFFLGYPWIVLGLGVVMAKNASEGDSVISQVPLTE